MQYCNTVLNLYFPSIVRGRGIPPDFGSPWFTLLSRGKQKGQQQLVITF